MCFGKKAKAQPDQAPGVRVARAPPRAQQAEDRQVIGDAGTIATILAQHVENFYVGTDLERARILHQLSSDVMIFFRRDIPVESHQGFIRNIKDEISKPPQEVDKTGRETHLQQLLELCSNFGQLIRNQDAQWQFQLLQPFGNPLPGSTVTTFPALMKGASQSRAPDTMVV